MLVGINCFKDTEICSMIESQKRLGICDITKEKNIAVYDTEQDEYLQDYFSDILDVYTPVSGLPNDFPKEYLRPLAETLKENWTIFTVNSLEVQKIVIEICKESYGENSDIFTQEVGIKEICDSSFLRKECLMKEFTWEQFKSSIKNINRFHSNHVNLELLQKLFESKSMHISYEAGELTLYRGRISDEKGFEKVEMGPPPLQYIKAGRANSAGIVCLYLAGDIETTFHEIRARDFDYVSVGEFVLKKSITIVDLSNLDNISPFLTGNFDSVWFAINIKILKQMSNEIAKPLRRQDSELDYLPAQYIADFVKSLGYDGIKFKSTLNPKGVNYAIFNHKRFKCQKVDLYYIKSMKYDSEPQLIDIGK